MDTCLYLDTARLGRMCRQAQTADRDFARLAGEEAGSMYFEQFLQWGFTCLPPSLARRYPGLSFWSGISGFKRDLTSVLAVSPERPVLVANRSAQLVRLAARLLCSRCESLLTTDMLWPAYRQILISEAARFGRRVVTVPVETALLRDGLGPDELVGYLASEYFKQNCDGLFLSAVTYHGVRLPIQDLMTRLAATSPPRFVVVDGAQALGHVPLALADCYCDLLLAGCHKWLRAYHPLGLAFCGNDRSKRLILDTCRDMRASRDLDDALLGFLDQIENGHPDRFSETVNLAPLLSTGAAVREMLAAPRSRRDQLNSQLQSADRAADEASHSSWIPIRTADTLRCGILLLEALRGETRLASVDVLRERFRRVGIALTAYAGGILRVSLPPQSLGISDWNLFRRAFQKLA